MNTSAAAALPADAERDESMEQEKVGIGAYIAFAFAVVIFSGVFYKMPEGYKWLGAFDFTTLIGKFGSMATAAGKSTTFVGAGGISARQGFLFSLNLFPGVMLAMGLMEVLTAYGALKAAQKLVTPLLRPLMGVPGHTALALITDLQSTDGGAAITRGMLDNGKINRENLCVICAWQYAGAGCIANYYSTVAALFASFLVPVWVPVLVILVMKFVAGINMRFILKTLYKKDFANE